jgi:hypothetical protein
MWLKFQRKSYFKLKTMFMLMYSERKPNLEWGKFCGIYFDLFYWSLKVFVCLSVCVSVSFVESLNFKTIFK